MSAVPVAMDEHGLVTDELEKALGANADPAFLYTIPTFQNPSGRTLPEDRRRQDRRARRRRRRPHPRGRPVRADQVRGRAAAVDVRPLGAGGDLHLVVLEDDRPRPPRRLLHRPRRACAGPADRPCQLDLHHPGAPQPGGRVRVHPPRQLRAEPRTRERAAEGPPRRDARGAREALLRRPLVAPGGRLLRLARAARGHRRRARSWSAPRASPPCSAPTSAAPPTRCGSRTASSRPTRSTRASRGSLSPRRRYV